MREVLEGIRDMLTTNLKGTSEDKPLRNVLISTPDLFLSSNQYAAGFSPVAVISEIEENFDKGDMGNTSFRVSKVSVLLIYESILYEKTALKTGGLYDVSDRIEQLFGEHKQKTDVWDEWDRLQGNWTLLTWLKQDQQGKQTTFGITREYQGVWKKREYYSGRANSQFDYKMPTESNIPPEKIDI